MSLYDWELLPLQIDSGFWYVATPYSKYPTGIEAAFVDACRFMADLVRHGIPAYSPIAHTHPIAIHGGLDPLDHSMWLPADEPMMRVAHGLIVCTMASWEASYGVSVEINTFKEAGKPIHFISPEGIRT